MAAMTSREVCELVGVTYRQLDYWCRLGLVEPTVPAHGQGSRRLFGPVDVARVRRLAAAAELRRRRLVELVAV